MSRQVAREYDTGKIRTGMKNNWSTNWWLGKVNGLKVTLKQKTIMENFFEKLAQNNETLNHPY